jgi:hypothetical protein
VTPDAFRRIALALADTAESAHMNHPDFRVHGRIFATLDSPSPGWGMVKLTPEQQGLYVSTYPGIFTPASGTWGRQGCTHVQLQAVNKVTCTAVLRAAYENALEKGPGSLAKGRSATRKSAAKVRRQRRR